MNILVNDMRVAKKGFEIVFHLFLMNQRPEGVKRHPDRKEEEDRCEAVDALHRDVLQLPRAHHRTGEKECDHAQGGEEQEDEEGGGQLKRCEQFSQFEGGEDDGTECE